MYAIAQLAPYVKQTSQPPLNDMPTISPTITATTPQTSTRFDNLSPYKKPQHTPPTSPFLNVVLRSARSGYSSNTSQSSYDSGYDSTASGPGNPPNSDHEEEQTAAAIYDARVVTYMTQPTSADPETPAPPPTKTHTAKNSSLATTYTQPAYHAHITQ